MRPAWLLLMLLALAGCRGTERPTRHLLVSGSRTITPLLQAIAARYEAATPGVRIDFDPGLSDRAVPEVRQGLADVGLLSRALRADEVGVIAHPFARDALAFIVHRDNPLPTLTENQLVGLFTRSYTNWKELGGSDRPVALVGVGEGRAVRQFVLDYLGLRKEQMRLDVTLSVSEQVVQTVATRPGGIGCVSIAATRQAIKTQPVRLVPLAGTMPDPETIVTHKYPFVRPVVLLTRPDSPEAIADFVRFACSPAQHDLFREHGLAPP